MRYSRRETPLVCASTGRVLCTEPQSSTSEFFVCREKKSLLEVLFHQLFFLARAHHIASCAHLSHSLWASILLCISFDSLNTSFALPSTSRRGTFHTRHNKCMKARALLSSFYSPAVLLCVCFLFHFFTCNTRRSALSPSTSL